MAPLRLCRNTVETRQRFEWRKMTVSLLSNREPQWPSPCPCPAPPARSHRKRAVSSSSSLSALQACEARRSSASLWSGNGRQLRRIRGQGGGGEKTGQGEEAEVHGEGGNARHGAVCQRIVENDRHAFPHPHSPTQMSPTHRQTHPTKARNSPR